jgi:hypothetical protein
VICLNALREVSEATFGPCPMKQRVHCFWKAARIGAKVLSVTKSASDILRHAHAKAPQRKGQRNRPIKSNGPLVFANTWSFTCFMRDFSDALRHIPACERTRTAWSHAYPGHENLGANATITQMLSGTAIIQHTVCWSVSLRAGSLHHPNAGVPLFEPKFRFIQ